MSTALLALPLLSAALIFCSSVFGNRSLRAFAASARHVTVAAPRILRSRQIFGAGVEHRSATDRVGIAGGGWHPETWPMQRHVADAPVERADAPRAMVTIHEGDRTGTIDVTVPKDWFAVDDLEIVGADHPMFVPHFLLLIFTKENGELVDRQQLADHALHRDIGRLLAQPCGKVGEELFAL
jgi:hypothetical protein